MKFEIYMDDRGFYHWRLLAYGGSVLALSKESYVDREVAHRAIVALQASIPVARIVDDAPFQRGASL